MIILPTTTPAAVTDLSNSNQTVHQQIQSSEQSRKATDTVQISAHAQELAGSGLQSRQSPAVQSMADNEAAEKVADNEIAETQRLSNPATGVVEKNRIDVVA